MWTTEEKYSNIGRIMLVTVFTVSEDIQSAFLTEFIPADILSVKLVFTVLI